MLVALILLGAIGAVIALNWEPEEKLGSVSASRFDSRLAGGGLSSKVLGTDVLVSSLQSTEPVGYQIVADAADEGVISEFVQVPPGKGWTSGYRLDGGDLNLSANEDKKFLLRYFPAEKEKANAIFEIGRRYGFYTSGITDALTALEDRTDALLDAFDARPLTVGVPEADLAAQAATLAADWDSWIDRYGDEPLEAQLAEARRRLVLVVAEVANNPTNPGLRRYNSAIREMNQAVDAYNAAL